MLFYVVLRVLFLLQFCYNCVGFGKIVAYRDDQADGLGQCCAKDERHAKKCKTPLHLRNGQKKHERKL